MSKDSWATIIVYGGAVAISYSYIVALMLAFKWIFL